MSELDAPAALLDKIAGHLGVADEPAPEAQPETTEEAAPSDGLTDFEWEGHQFRVPESLTKAVMLNKDYTQKTQELSRSREAIEQLQAMNEARQSEIAFVSSIANEQQELGIIDQYLKQIQSIDWSKLSSEQMMRQKIELDQIRDRRVALADSINGKRSKFASDLQARIKDLRGKSKEQASKSIEGFTEETDQTIRNYAKSEGLSEREIDNLLLDPRAYRLFWKAKQFDDIKANAARGGKQAPSGVVRPGVAGERMPAETAQKLNFAKAMKSAKSSQQKANLIEDRLQRVFTRGK
jgi:hypothetical protein